MSVFKTATKTIKKNAAKKHMRETETVSVIAFLLSSFPIENYELILWSNNKKYINSLLK